ncbi:MAG TPA: tRNA threonylcarbamoyladenosine dehydratase [Verrucomicrobiae bacterium]
MSDYQDRFGGIGRLYGQAGLARLQQAQVAVIGIGGVGTWTAEALARSGVGRLTLVDLDEICVTNINRQLHALTETVGQAKVTVMADRIRAINPACEVRVEPRFFNEQTADELLAPPYAFVVDAIDSVRQKTLLLARCRARQLPVIACGAAGGRRDGTQVRTADLARVTHDRLLAEVRKRLRKEYGFPADGSDLGIPCVYSAEAPVFAQTDGTVCALRPATEDGTRLNCNSGLGSATFVTGAFGFAAAGWVVTALAAQDTAKQA